MSLKHLTVAVDLAVLPVSYPQHHTVAVAMVLVLVLVLVLVMAVQLVSIQAHLDHQQAMEPVLVLVMVLLVVDMIPHQHTAHKLLLKHMQLMLKVSSKIQIHKSFVVQLLVVYKPIHKTSKFDFFNHHQSHPQAQSSS